MSKKAYDEDFKQQAVVLAGRIGMKKAASKLHIQYSMLREWCNGSSEAYEDPRDAIIAEQERKINDLTKASVDKDRELERLQKEHEILQATIKYFSETGKINPDDYPGDKPENGS